MYRTHTCGELRPEHAGQETLLAGWVHRRRDHGPLIFIDLRDRYGITQVVFDSTAAPFNSIARCSAQSAPCLLVLQLRHFWLCSRLLWPDLHPPISSSPKKRGRLCGSGPHPDSSWQPPVLMLSSVLS